MAARLATAMDCNVSDGDIADLQRLMGWAPEPKPRPFHDRTPGASFYEIGKAVGLSHNGAALVYSAALKKLRRRHPELRDWL